MSSDSKPLSRFGLIPKFKGNEKPLEGEVGYNDWADMIKLAFTAAHWKKFLDGNFKLEDCKPAEERLNEEIVLAEIDAMASMADKVRRQKELEENLEAWEEYDDLTTKYCDAELALKAAICTSGDAFKVVRAQARKPIGHLWAALERKYTTSGGNSTSVIMEVLNLEISDRNISAFVDDIRVKEQEYMKTSGKDAMDDDLKKTSLIRALKNSGVDDFNDKLHNDCLAKMTTKTFEELAKMCTDFEKAKRSTSGLDEAGTNSSHKAFQAMDGSFNRSSHRGHNKWRRGGGDRRYNSHNQGGGNNQSGRSGGKFRRGGRRGGRFKRHNDHRQDDRNARSLDNQEGPGGDKNKANNTKQDNGNGRKVEDTSGSKPFKTLVVRVNAARASSSNIEMKLYGDSGAERHIISGAFLNYFQKHVTDAKASSATVQFGAGAACTADAEVTLGKLTKALVVEKASADCNLLSLSRVDDAGGVIIIKDKKMHVFPPGTSVQTNERAAFIGTREGGLYAFNASDVCGLTTVAPATLTRCCKLNVNDPRYLAISWHRTLAHSCNYQKLATMAKHGSAYGLSPSDASKFTKAARNHQYHPCMHCALGAFPQFAVGNELRPAREYDVGQYWHIDLIDIRVRSIGGKIYTFLANDNFSSYTIDIHLPNKKPKKSIIPALRSFINKVRVLGKEPKFLHFDADTVFESEDVKDYLTNTENIEIGFSEPGEHRHSGTIENMARYVQDGMRKLLVEAEAEDKFWTYAVSQVVYVHNRILTTRHKDNLELRYKTPYEIMKERKPDLSKIAPWGVACVSRIPNPRTLGKTVPRGRPGVILGNAEEYNDGLYVYNLKTKRVIVSKDVRVDATRCGFTGKPIDWSDGERGDYRPENNETVPMPVGDQDDNNNLNVDDIHDHVDDGIDEVDQWVDPHGDLQAPSLSTSDEMSVQEPDYAPSSTLREEGEPSETLSDKGDHHEQETESHQDIELKTATDKIARRRPRKEHSSTPSTTENKKRHKRARRGNKKREVLCEPEVNPYDIRYRTGSQDRRLRQPPQRPALSGTQQLLKRKIREAAAKRLGETAVKMQLRSRAIERSNHRAFLAILLTQLNNDEEDTADTAPVMRETFRAFAAGTLDPDIPRNYAEAMSDKFRANFEPAIRAELESIRLNKVFGKPVRLPKGRKPLGVRWCFDIKRNKDGSVERYKARLVAKGFTQVWGESYTDTFAATPSKEAIRLVLSLAAMYRLQTFQGDVKTAFLNAIMEEEVFTKIPEGWDASELDSNMVLPMERCLYGTKQASRQWQKKLRESLESIGFKNIEADECVYILRREDKWILLVAYVDDLFGTTNDSELINWFNSEMSRMFDYKPLGPISKLLGTWVDYLQDGSLKVSAPLNIKKLLERYSMSECVPAASPMEPGGKLYPARPGEELLDASAQVEYQALVGSLLFLAISCRPDISHAVNELGRFVSKPTEHHWNTAKRVLRYLAGTVDDGLVFTAGSTNMDTSDIKLQLVSYSDASWADSSDRKSTSGMLIQVTTADNNQQEYITGNVLAYSSKRQPCVALSSTEAEYVALSKAAQSITWLRRLIQQLGFADGEPTITFEDNTSAISVSLDEGLSQRTKHIDTRHHYIRDQIRNGSIIVEYIQTTYQLADYFTKALPIYRFEWLRERLMWSRREHAEHI
jgi:Reverse transcriptase (RNA-dependent DNA polymerase)